MALPKNQVYRDHLRHAPRSHAPTSSSTTIPAPPRLAQDFETLHSLARHSKVVFRVHSPLSISPLLWTSSLDTSGFISPNSHIGCLSSRSYTRTFGSIRGTGGWDGPYWRHSMVDHITGQAGSTCLWIPATIQESEGVIPEDNKSPWISTTRSLTWGVWSIARQLALPEGTHGATDQVDLAIIRHHSGMVSASDARRGYLELHTAPSGKIREAFSARRTGEMTMSVVNTYERAAKESGASEEVLYYGRVFAENIESNLEFTKAVSKSAVGGGGVNPKADMSSHSMCVLFPSRLPCSMYPWLDLLSFLVPYQNPGWSDADADADAVHSQLHPPSLIPNLSMLHLVPTHLSTPQHLPLPLPPQFTKARTSRPSRSKHQTSSPSLDGWLSNLVWDPSKDDFTRAEGKVVERRRQVGMSRGVKRNDCVSP